MQKTKVIGLALIAILVVAAAANYAYAATTKVKVPDYIAFAEQTRDKAKELASFAESKGLNVTRIKAAVDKGSALLEEAKSLLKNNETARAVKKAHEAMEYFIGAIKALDHGFVNEIRKEETVRTLQTAIKRHEEHIQKIREEVRASKVSQSVKNEVNKHLDDAQRHLNLAKEALRGDDPDVKKAAHELREANHEIHKAVKIFREATKGRSGAKSNEVRDRKVREAGKKIREVGEDKERFKDVRTLPDGIPAQIRGEIEHRKHRGD